MQGEVAGGGRIETLPTAEHGCMAEITLGPCWSLSKATSDLRLLKTHTRRPEKSYGRVERVLSTLIDD
jgi:hypothetical protein